MFNWFKKSNVKKSENSTPQQKPQPIKTWKNSEFEKSFKIINNYFAALSFSTKDKVIVYDKADSLNLRNHIWFNYITPLSESTPVEIVEKNLLEIKQLCLSYILNSTETATSELLEFYNAWAEILNPEKKVSKIPADPRVLYNNAITFFKKPNSKFDI